MCVSGFIRRICVCVVRFALPENCNYLFNKIAKGTSVNHKHKVNNCDCVRKRICVYVILNRRITINTVCNLYNVGHNNNVVVTCKTYLCGDTCIFIIL